MELISDSQAFIFAENMKRIIGIFLLACCNLALQSQTMGLFYNSPDSFNGYTLFSNNTQTYLIDNCGFKVNEWESSYQAAGGLQLTDEGQLLRMGRFPSSDFVAGGASGIIELFGWEGDLLWSYQISNQNQRNHHDLCLLPNGNFLCLIWERKTASEVQSQGRADGGEIWSESIWEIKILPDNEAEIVWSWQVWDHLLQNQNPQGPNFLEPQEHPERLDINYLGPAGDQHPDWLHFNSIAYNEALDQIAISCRNTDEFYIIDHSTTSAEAASNAGGHCGRGGDFLLRFGNPHVYSAAPLSHQILKGQHHVDWIQSGQYAGAFSLFNNYHLGQAESAALILSNPVNGEGCYNADLDAAAESISILHSYEDDIFSNILSGNQVLPNNNMLITQGKGGRILEVNPNNEIVWLYINPVNQNGGPGIQGGTPVFNNLFRAKRYPVDHPAFADKIIQPTVQVELSPDEFPCEIYPAINTTLQNIVHNQAEFDISWDPFSRQLELQSNAPKHTKVTLYNLLGQPCLSAEMQKGLNQMDCSNLPSDVYIISSNFHSKMLLLD